MEPDVTATEHVVSVDFPYGGWVFTFRRNKYGELEESSYGHHGTEEDPEMVRAKRRKAQNAVLARGYTLRLTETTVMC